MDRRRLTGLACVVWIGALLAACGTADAQSLARGQTQSASQLPAAIPIFPLEDATLFPSASRALHIFEPRYRAMVADALKGDRVIGMVTLKPGYERNYDGRPPIFAIGCAGVITDVEELPDGRFNIVLRGTLKFRVSAEEEGRPYRLARVEAVPERLDGAGATTLHESRQRLEVLVSAGSGSKIPPDLADEEVINSLALYVPLDPPERQALLELKDALARSQALIKLLELIAPRPRR
jgi:Lon protease-like protein